jgi:sulfur relay (sulfurtransferase) DsrC/TusE family protein
LRVLRLDYLDVDFRVEGRKIHCDEDTLNLIYLARITDTNEWDQLLIEAIAARLAADTAFALVQSTSLVGTLYSLYETKLSEARFVDATEGTPGAIQNVTVSGSLQSDTLVNARL